MARKRQIASVEDLISRAKDLQGQGEGWIYRGQPVRSYKLIPKAGRPPFCEINDLDLFDEWRRKAVAYLPTLPSDEWEALAIAQHHGLATRLLDWTFKYSVAAYFAARDNPDSDGVVYCYYPPRFDTATRPQLRSLQAVCMFSPPLNTSRIISQEGVFTCHPKPREPFDETSDGDESQMLTILLPAGAKPQMLRDLDALGVNEASLFPDLDGLSRHMNWKTSLHAAFLAALGRMRSDQREDMADLLRRSQRGGQ